MTDSRHPTSVTIGITCYNAEETIERAVASAFAQTWQNFRVVVVDDASTDASVQILSRLQARYPRLDLVQHPKNMGVAGAANTILDMATTDLVAFFDDDDESRSDRLARQVARFEAYTKGRSDVPILCFSSREIVEPGGNAVTTQWTGIGSQPTEPRGAEVADYILGLLADDGSRAWGALGRGTLLASTADLRELGGFDVNFRRCEELDLAVRAALQGAHFISDPECLLRQYVSISPDKGREIDLRYRLLLVRKHADYLRKKRAYVGALCYAQSRVGRRKMNRVWRLAALIFFPQKVRRQRLGAALRARRGNG